MKSTRRGSFSGHRSEKNPGSKYSSTSGLSPRGHLERQAEFHASTQDEAWLSCLQWRCTLHVGKGLSQVGMCWDIVTCLYNSNLVWSSWHREIYSYSSVTIASIFMSGKCEIQSGVIWSRWKFFFHSMKTHFLNMCSVFTFRHKSSYDNCLPDSHVVTSHFHMVSTVPMIDDQC